jgi:hypothetical protein
MTLYEEKMLEMLTFSERLDRFRKTLEQAFTPLFNLKEGE